MSHATILIVEDEAIVAMHIHDQLERAGFQVIGPVHTVKDARGIVSRGVHLDLAILDIRLKGNCDGIELGQELRDLGISILYLTAYTDERTLKRAEKTGPIAFVKKPVATGELLRHVEAALGGKR